MVPEWTEKNWQTQGSCGYILPPLSVQRLQVTMDQCPTFVVVHGNGQILNRICKDIVQFSQRLLDALGNQGRWDVAAIKRELNQMSTMIMEYHEHFQGNWCSGFVRMGQGGPVEMIITRKVRAVSVGVGGHDVNCLTELLTFNSPRCLSRASMNALIHVVDHANKSYEATRLGWRDVISGTHNLLTCRDLERFGALCNDDHDVVEGEYHLYKEWQSSFLGCPTYIPIEMGSRVTRKMKGARKKAGVAAPNPMVDMNTSLHITSGLRMLGGSCSFQTRRLDTANLRYVRMLLFFIGLC